MHQETIRHLKAELNYELFIIADYRDKIVKAEAWIPQLEAAIEALESIEA
jgi:hypothetical protein